MAAATSGPERTPRAPRATQRFGTIIVVGGGCYGSYYVRQLARAERAGALAWRELVVVDRDAGCRVALLDPADRPTALRVECAEWRTFFAEYLTGASTHPADVDGDAIVPSPLMPHLMADWLTDRARARWPDRRVATEPMTHLPVVPWQRGGDDGTHYVSFAEWMCPINCIEPARCPHTRGERTWSLPVTLRRHGAQERAGGRPVEGPFIFHCAHRAFGVGMIDVRDVLAADRAVALRGRVGPMAFLVGTASHCHGALRRVVVE